MVAAMATVTEKATETKGVCVRVRACVCERVCNGGYACVCAVRTLPRCVPCCVLCVHKRLWIKEGVAFLCGYGRFLARSDALPPNADATPADADAGPVVPPADADAVPPNSTRTRAPDQTSQIQNNTTPLPPSPSWLSLRSAPFRLYPGMLVDTPRALTAPSP